MSRLKIAIQKSGRLFEDTLKLLKDAALKIEISDRQLKTSVSNFGADVLLLRNSDIPEYVADGVADIGVIGYNTLVESQKKVEEVYRLGFAKCRLSIAVPKDSNYRGIKDLEGKKIATSYPNSLRIFLEKNKISAKIVEISGSVEIAPQIGMADYICDLVSSGNTLFINNLEEKEVLFESEACVIAQKNLSDSQKTILKDLLFRIESVLNGRKHKYIMMNVPKQNIDKVFEILNGLKSPTILSLADENWKSVHSVIAIKDQWEIVQKLKEIGAEDILITSIEEIIP